MAATASAAPVAVRTPSSPRRQDMRSDQPQRTQSMAVRTTSQSRSTSSQPSRQALGNVGRRDQEQPSLNTASTQPSSDNKASMDAARAAMQAPRTTSARQQSESRTPTNGTVAQPDSTRTNAQGQRRRTTVTAQTGTWALQKTIGQGSMGKVKLATNQETKEQVRSNNVQSTHNTVAKHIIIGRDQDHSTAIHR
jgi:hypothetical protein